MLSNYMGQAVDLFRHVEEKLSAGDYISPMAYQMAAFLYFTEKDACMKRESAKEVKNFLINNGILHAALVLALSDDKDYVGVAEEMRAAAGRYYTQMYGRRACKLGENESRMEQK